MFGWTDGIMKRIIAFVLKRSIGRFVYDLDPSQIAYSVRGGKMEIENVQLNVKGINEQLRDIPLELINGHIERISVDIPNISRLFKDSMCINVSGLWLNFRLKETMSNDHLTQLMSSILTESIIGDPSMLASSIMVDTHDNNVSSKDIREDQGKLAEAVEEIVSKIKITIETVTIRADFPAEKNNVLLVHFPRLDFSDQTKENKNRQAFAYNFIFSGFFVQLFEEEHHVKSEVQDLNEGNSIVFCETKNNAIRITTNEIDNKLLVMFDVSAIHAVLMPKQVQILINIGNAVSKMMTQANSVITRRPTRQFTQSVVHDLSATVVTRMSATMQSIDSMTSSVMLDSIRASNFHDPEEFHEVDEYSDDSVDFENEVTIENDEQFVKKIDVSNHISLEMSVKLGSASFSILYETTDLQKTWESFIKRGTTIRSGFIVNAPSMPVEHISIQGTDFAISTVNAIDSNEMNFTVGNIIALEVLDEILSRRIIDFETKRSQSKVQYLVNVNRATEKTITDITIQPMIVNMNTGMLQRFMSVLNSTQTTTSSHGIEDIDTDNSCMEAYTTFNMDSITITTSLPVIKEGISSKKESRQEKIRIDVRNISCVFKNDEKEVLLGQVKIVDIRGNDINKDPILSTTDLRVLIKTDKDGNDSVSVYPFRLDVIIAPSQVKLFQDISAAISASLGSSNDTSPSDKMIDISIEQGSKLSITVLSDTDDKQAFLVFDGLSANIILDGNTYEIVLDCENVSLDEIADELQLPRHLLRNHKRLVRGDDKKALGIELEITMDPVNQITKTNVKKLQLDGIHFELYENSHAFALLGALGTGDAQGASVTMASVIVRDVCVDYRIPLSTARVLCMFQQFELHTPNALVSTTDTKRYNSIIPEVSLVRMKVQDLLVMLHPNFDSDLIDMIEDRQSSWSELGILSDLNSWGFLQLLSLDRLDVELSTLKEGIKPTAERPPTLVQIGKGALTIGLCYDSMQTLLQIGNRETIVEQPVVEEEFSVTSFGQTSNLLRSIETDKFKQKKPSAFVIQEDYLQVDHTLDRTDVVVTPITRTKETDHVEKFPAFSTAVLLENYFPIYTRTVREAPSRVLSPKEFSTPQMEIVANDLNIVFYLYAGSDWDNKRDRHRYLQLSLLDCNIQYDTFDEKAAHEYRTSLSIRDIEILDKRKEETVMLLSQWNDDTKPREDNSNVLEIVIKCMRGGTGSELNVRVDILPLHIDLHQETYMFITTLFPQREEQPVETIPVDSEHKDDAFFQSFETSEVVLVITTTASNRTITGIVGDFKQAMFMVPLKGATLKLAPIKLKNIQGASMLTEQVTSMLFDQVNGTNVLGFLLGIVPIRSLYNVVGGISDLFVLPVQQYQREGRILRGLRRGVTSFASNIGTETVALPTSWYHYFLTYF